MQYSTEFAQGTRGRCWAEKAWKRSSRWKTLSLTLGPSYRGGGEDGPCGRVSPNPRLRFENPPQQGRPSWQMKPQGCKGTRGTRGTGGKRRGETNACAGGETSSKSYPDGNQASPTREEGPNHEASGRIRKRESKQSIFKTKQLGKRRRGGIL